MGEEAGHHHGRTIVIVPAVDDGLLADEQLDALVAAYLSREVEGAHLGPVLVVDVHWVAQEESGKQGWSKMLARGCETPHDVDIAPSNFWRSALHREQQRRVALDVLHLEQVLHHSLPVQLQRRFDQHLHDDVTCVSPEGARLVKRCLLPEQEV